VIACGLSGEARPGYSQGFRMAHDVETDVKSSEGYVDQVCTRSSNKQVGFECVSAQAVDIADDLLLIEPRRKARRSTSQQFETFSDMKLNPAFRIISLNLYQGSFNVIRDNIRQYYKMCMESRHLHVTTSCFTIWKNNKRTNGSAKVIPALPTDGSMEDDDKVVVFFFDDNLDFGGTEDSIGICNLRNVCTGDFVDFAEGRNGFQRDMIGRHTVLHHSEDFRNILVKANILDALTDKDYFTNIIRRYARPQEKILVFMDVNSTIVCYDQVQGKDVAKSLMSSMFELIEVRPSQPFLFKWDGASEPVMIDKAISLKNLIKQITNSDKAAYAAFFEEETCARLLEELQKFVETKYSSPAGVVNSESFFEDFKYYLDTLDKEPSPSGIVSSWFRVYEFLTLQDENHCVVLNSYGVDTRKVVLETVEDEREVMQITINYELWSAADVKVFEEQYCGVSPRVASKERTG